MPTSQHGDPAVTVPGLTIAPQVDPAAVRAQLDRILASPLFRNSKRYPNLLRYVVEQVLTGHGGELKERTLGIEVFGRTPDYDTNIDPVVRISAAEIRKRIAQYYHEEGRAEEIRIDIPLGSYVPEFRLPVAAPALAPTPAPLEIAPALAVPPKRRLVPFPPALLLAALPVLFLAGLIAGHPWRATDPLDGFWKPVLDRNASVLLCIGHLHDADGRAHGVGLSDSTTLARLSGLLQSRGKTWMVRAEDQATFGDLRQGPVILIGAYNDSWTLRMGNSLRFSFRQDDKIHYIEDRQNPGSRRWSAPVAVPGVARVVNEDYALISRVIDPATDRVMVTIGGILGYGTLAAGEFVTDAKYMEAFAAHAPAGWQKKNLQLVIQTEVILEHSGPPRVVASYFW